jgi:hypothetical protein
MTSAHSFRNIEPPGTHCGLRQGTVAGAVEARAHFADFNHSVTSHLLLLGLINGG